MTTTMIVGKPRWEEILSAIDRLYMTEYGIAERGGCVDKVLKD
jgi:hypothetical protein